LLYCIAPRDFRKRVKEAAKKQKPLKIRGRHGDISGCLVWETREEAEAYLHKQRKRYAGCEVFGLKGRWPRDTLPSREEEGQRELGRDVTLVPLALSQHGLVKAKGV